MATGLITTGENWPILCANC